MKRLLGLMSVLVAISSFSLEAADLTLRATAIRHPNRPQTLYAVAIPHSRTPQSFNLTTNTHPTALFCIPDENTGGVWNCFDNCTGNGPGGTWGNCQYIGFCVEGYNNNSSICHF